MELREEILRSEEVVKVLIEGIDQGDVSLKEAEERIVDYINRIGGMLLEEVVQGIAEPVLENREMVTGEMAVFDGERKLRFLNRFGRQTVRLRRFYKYVKNKGGWFPLAFGPSATLIHLLWPLLTAGCSSQRLTTSIASFTSLATASIQISPGISHTLSRLCPPHLLPCFPCKYWALSLFASSPNTAASCDSCSSGQRFSYTLLQIPPRGEHPCCSATYFPLPGVSGTFTP